MEATETAILAKLNFNWALLLEFTRVLVWPLLILFVVSYFRKNFAGFLDRLYKAKFPGGVEVEAEQQKTSQVPSEEEQTSVEGELAKQKELIDTIRKEYEGKLERTQKGAKKLVDDLISEISIRDLQIDFERVYNLIFGSQIAFLENLLVRGSVGSFPQEVLAYFITVRKVWQPAFNTWTLDQYLNFLLTRHLVELTYQGNYRITYKGKAFLSYITNLRYSKNKSL